VAREFFVVGYNGFHDAFTGNVSVTR
jgi:hypothetical protein